MHSRAIGCRKADECASAGQKTIETKTRAYDDRHLARVRDQVAWLSRRRRRWCPDGAVPVVCLVRARGVDRVEQTVLVVSIDRLIAVLGTCAAGLPPAGSAWVDASIAASVSGERGRIGSLAHGAHGTEFPACRAKRDWRRRRQDARGITDAGAIPALAGGGGRALSVHCRAVSIGNLQRAESPMPRVRGAHRCACRVATLDRDRAAGSGSLAVAQLALPRSNVCGYSAAAFARVDLLLSRGSTTSRFSEPRTTPYRRWRWHRGVNRCARSALGAGSGRPPLNAADQRSR